MRPTSGGGRKLAWALSTITPRPSRLMSAEGRLLRYTGATSSRGRDLHAMEPTRSINSIVVRIRMQQQIIAILVGQPRHPQQTTTKSCLGTYGYAVARCAIGAYIGLYNYLGCEHADWLLYRTI